MDTMSAYTDAARDFLYAEDLSSARDAFRSHAAGLGMRAYCYVHLNGPGLGYDHLDTTYPAQWGERYLRKRYMTIDPVVAEAHRSHRPFAWHFLTNRPGITTQQRLLFTEAAEMGLKDGLSIPFHGRDGLSGILSLAFDTSAQVKATLDQSSQVEYLGISYHAAVERLLETADERGLTIFENQCLTWAAAGRKLWDISATLHVPEDNIATALLSARRKLGTATTNQTIEKALAQGLIAV